MTDNIKVNLIRYVVSTIITFLAASLAVLLSQLEALLESGNPLSKEILYSMAFGAVIAGVRAVLKYLYEFVVPKLQSAINKLNGSD